LNVSCCDLCPDLPVTDRYVDNDVSAYNGRVRPEYRRLLDDIGRG
jgi:hypothetical protein